MNKATKNHAPRTRPIFIVDDEKSYLDLLASLLAENLDCPVHAFTRPMDALEALSSVSPAVIVTDYFMPEIDGVEFIRRATVAAPHAVFIMISGNNLDPIRRELSRLKALKARLAKPFGWEALAKAVVRVWPGNDVPVARAGGP